MLVTDADEGSNAEIHYTLSGSDADHFTVDGSGQIRVCPLGVDYETVFDNPYVLVVTAMDLGEDWTGHCERDDSCMQLN